MLFNSFAFIFMFLPATLVGYFLLNKWNQSTAAKWWLFLASLFFYSFWTMKNLPILLISVLVNYFLGQKISSLSDESAKKPFFYSGLIFNIGLLSFFKYGNEMVHGLKLLLPLGISFFTIQQIAYLVDTYQGLNGKKKFIDYGLFVTFFPHVTAGPIAYSQELLPQLESTENKKFNSDRFSLGIFIFCMGLFKKVIIADSFSQWASPGFDEGQTLDFFAAWKTSLSYTFQLYFDFCGYSEMAMGIGHMFNIKIAQNFNSPFKSKNIIEFWGKWHMTLGKFINTYMFTPMAKMMPKMTFRYIMIATFLSMFIAGIWHGVGLTFVVYGAMHGLALVINHNWKKKKIKMPAWLAWLITFQFVNLSFVVFRAKEFLDVKRIGAGMLGLTGVKFPKGIFKSLGPLQNWGWELSPYLKPDDYLLLVMILGAFIVVKYTRNLMEMTKDFNTGPKYAVLSAVIFVISLFGLNRVTEFIYFKF